MSRRTITIKGERGGTPKDIAVIGASIGMYHDGDGLQSSRPCVYLANHAYTPAEAREIAAALCEQASYSEKLAAANDAAEKAREAALAAVDAEFGVDVATEETPKPSTTRSTMINARR